MIPFIISEIFHIFPSVYVCVLGCLQGCHFITFLGELFSLCFSLSEKADSRRKAPGAIMETRLALAGGAMKPLTGNGNSLVNRENMTGGGQAPRSISTTHFRAFVTSRRPSSDRVALPASSLDEIGVIFECQGQAAPDVLLLYAPICPSMIAMTTDELV